MKSLHLSPSGALKKGWELTKKHFIVMLGLVLGYMVLLWVISLLSGADTTTFRYWILYLVNLVLSVWVNAGFAKILLNAYDGEEPSFSVFGELLPKLGGLIGVSDGYSVFGAAFGVFLYCFAADVRRLCLRRRFFYRGYGCGS